MTSAQIKLFYTDQCGCCVTAAIQHDGIIATRRQQGIPP